MGNPEAEASKIPDFAPTITFDRKIKELFDEHNLDLTKLDIAYEQLLAYYERLPHPSKPGNLEGLLIHFSSDAVQRPYDAYLQGLFEQNFQPDGNPVITIYLGSILSSSDSKDNPHHTPEEIINNTLTHELVHYSQNHMYPKTNHDALANKRMRIRSFLNTHISDIVVGYIATAFTRATIFDNMKSLIAGITLGFISSHLNKPNRQYSSDLLNYLLSPKEVDARFYESSTTKIVSLDSKRKE